MSVPIVDSKTHPRETGSTHRGFQKFYGGVNNHSPRLHFKETFNNIPEYIATV